MGRYDWWSGTNCYPFWWGRIRKNRNIKGELSVDKNELISSIANETGLTKTDSAKALDAFVSTITSALKSGDEVRLVGFGTFAAKKRDARDGINPLTKEPLHIPAKTVASFKAGSKLKDALN